MWHLVGFSCPHWITMHFQPHIKEFDITTARCNHKKSDSKSCLCCRRELVEEQRKYRICKKCPAIRCCLRVIFIGALAYSWDLKFATMLWNVHMISPIILSEEWSRLVCYVIFIDKYLPTLWRTVMPSSSTEGVEMVFRFIDSLTLKIKSL